MTNIRIHKIEARSLVDGPGERTVLFMQGCPIECPGCQNRHLWDKAGGRVEPVEDVAETLANLAGPGGQITISGGEPFAQPRALVALLRLLRDVYEVAHVIVYTGYTWEQLIDQGFAPADVHLSVLAALSRIDVVVDGPFIKALDDPFISYRGSRNQRPIDVQASNGKPNPVVLDWGFTEIAISTNGSAFVPVGLVIDFADLGNVNNARMCGQTKGVPK